MINDDLFRQTKYMAPPEDLEAAIERVGEAGINSFMGLIGLVFLDVGQFQKAMAHYGWNVNADSLIMDGGRVKTYKALALGADGTMYYFILNEIGPWHCEVVNCRLAKAGTAVRPDDLKAFRETLQGEGQ